MISAFTKLIGTAKPALSGGVDRRVDADHLAAQVDQRPARIAGVIEASVWMKS